jgi:hypothetical protein
MATTPMKPDVTRAEYRKFHKTDIPKSRRNRIHFDLRCESRTAEVSRLMELGARTGPAQRPHRNARS